MMGAAAGSGEGIIEGTAVKVGAMDKAAGGSETEGADKFGPTDWNGSGIWLGLAGRPDFT
jgi:hypothetical protein